MEIWTEFNQLLMPTAESQRTLIFFRITHVSAEGMVLVLGDQKCKQARIYDPDHVALHKTSGGSWVTVRVHPQTCFAKTRDSLAGVSLFLSYSQCCRVAGTRL